MIYTKESTIQMLKEMGGRDVFLHQLTDVYALIVSRPFPSPYIITDTVSRMMPQLPQRVVFQYTQILKNKISEYEHGKAPTHANN
jgi:hypothetical protein